MKNLYRLVLLLACALFIASCGRSGSPKGTAGDVAFAQSTFESLARGDTAVADRIDWPVFTSLGQNLGATYVALDSEVEREKFKTGFITQFATAFRESGGSVEGFSNWRVVSHDSQKTEVAADSANGVLTIIVSERDNVERVSSINLIQ